MRAAPVHTLLVVLTMMLAGGMHLQAQQPRVLAVVNAATYQPVVAPGSVAVIFGLNLARETALAPGYPLPRELAGVQVRLSGPAGPAGQEQISVIAPLFYISPNQINFQVPSSAAQIVAGSAFLEVITPWGKTARSHVNLQQRAPGIFTVDGTPCGRPLVFNIDEQGNRSLNAPNEPAKPGQLIAIYLTGFGVAGAQPLDGYHAH